jgi:hypothetical protein
MRDLVRFLALDRRVVEVLQLALPVGEAAGPGRLGPDHSRDCRYGNADTDPDVPGTAPEPSVASKLLHHLWGRWPSDTSHAMRSALLFLLSVDVQV